MTDLARVDTTAAGGGVIVHVHGEIDLSNATTVRDSIAAAVPNLPVVVVDLSGTEYLDSAGIAMLFRLAERLGYNRQELRLVVPASAPIRAVVRLTGLDQVVRVTSSAG